jgi:hypothetical protein
MALTDTFIKQAKWTGKPTGDKHSDGQGLYLHVKASGKYWRMAYRYLGKQKTLAIGIYPAVTLAQARKATEKARGLLAQDIGPQPSQTRGQGHSQGDALMIEKLSGTSPPDVIEAQLAHGKSGPLGMAYDRTEYMEQRRAMMQQWGDYLDKLRTGDTVIPFRVA